jgi:hypothetical protein
MNQSEVLSVKAAAREADTHAAQVFMAIRRGLLRVRKQGGRTLILRDSFSDWKRRLETKRALRREERIATSALNPKKTSWKSGPKRAAGEPQATDGASR